MLAASVRWWSNAKFMTKGSASAVDRLLQGVASDQVKLVRDTWQELHLEKVASASEVRNKLQTDVWETDPQGPLTRYFGVLLALLHELDPEAFHEEVKRLKGTKLNSLHRLTLNLLAQRCRDVPATVLANATPLFVSDEIKHKAAVVESLSRWSSTPGVCLQGVTRIDVIAANPRLEYLGLYSPFYSRIVLTWELDYGRGLFPWLQKLKLEQTFYHEVGHHVLGHIERGQVPDQEKSADRFAAKLLQISWPKLARTIRILLWPYTFYRRLK